MKKSLTSKVDEWYKQSAKRAVSLKQLCQHFQKETDCQISYNHFRVLSNNVSKVQNIKTGGYYVRFNDFVEMTVSRAINGVNFNNTICVDEKPFAPKKYRCKDLRVHKSFKGRGTATMVNSTDQLHNISPFYLICAISNSNVVLYYISEKPIDSEIFNTFLWKLNDQFPHNDEKKYFLCDNASFHGVTEITQNYLNSNNCFITRTAALGCFTNPIEEFFSIVHNNFEWLLGQRFLESDTNLSKDEYVKLIEQSIIMASKTCNYRIIFARAGLL